MKISKHYIVLGIVAVLFISNFFLFKNQSFYWKFNFIILFVHLFILYVGVTRYRLNYFSNAISSGKKNGLSLTFDDGPNPEYTSKVLDILKARNLKATFFVIGKNIAGNEEILKRIDAEGHIIGNHSFGHIKWFNSIAAKKIIADINRANDTIYNIIQKQPRYFRAPFGLTSPNIAKALAKTDYLSIAWDFRSFDTMAKDKKKLLTKLKKYAKRSSIVLLHDNNELTLSVLEGFLDFCLQNGIKIVSLDKMIGENAYQ